MFTFVTSNPLKIKLAANELTVLNIAYTVQDIELEEIQSLETELIIRKKAQNAYNQLASPVLVNDHSWDFPALSGFPGPFAKYINMWLTAEQILRLLQGAQDRRAVLTDTLCYKDENTEQVFHRQIDGYALKEVKGDGIPLQQIICLTKDDRSAAEVLAAGDTTLFTSHVFTAFGEWYKNQKYFV